MLLKIVVLLMHCHAKCRQCTTLEKNYLFVVYCFLFCLFLCFIIILVGKTKGCCRFQFHPQLVFCFSLLCFGWFFNLVKCCSFGKCSRFFASVAVRDEHFKTKKHRRRYVAFASVSVFILSILTNILPIFKLVNMGYIDCIALQLRLFLF